MSRPYFSVVVPTYNRASLIKTAIDSVFSQTFADYELIIVDDGSTDDTVAVVTALFAGSNCRARLIQQQNAGPGAARNRGIREATGDYVALLDSDDVWFPWTLANFHRAISEKGRPAFICGVPLDIGPGEPMPQVDDRELLTENYRDFLSVTGNPFFRFTTSGVVVSRSALDRVGGFTDGGYEDLDLWMRLGVEPGFVIITSPPAVVRRILGRNLSNSREYNRRGTAFMIQSEKKGRYPGAADRGNDRRRLLGTLMRAQSFGMARRGEFTTAMSVYFRLLGWNLADGRIRYLLGLPVTALAGVFKRSV